MYNQTRTQLGFEPGGFGRHNIAGIGNANQLLHRYRVKGKGGFHFSGINSLLQGFESTYASHKIDALRGALILDVQNTFEDLLRQDGNIKGAIGVGIVVGSLPGYQAVPLVTRNRPNAVNGPGLN